MTTATPGPVALGTMSDAQFEAITAELMLAVYDARRLARLRYLGLEPPPVPSRRALRMYRQAQLPR